MKRGGIPTILVAVAAGSLAMFAASRLVNPINAQRRDLQLNWTEQIGASLPPDMALTQAALGTFRGAAVNVLWYRAAQLKEEGRFHEAMQIANWITTLQPRFPLVWEFNSWNMSYNISVATHTPEERWMWVDAGMRLLRDKGIPSNPNSQRLYRQLAWILLHKIGQDTDDMHGYYKLRFAEQWHDLLGAPPAGTMSEYDAWFDQFVNPPDQDSAGRMAILRERHRMDPIFMRNLARQYGPLDWRHPAAHALYWASLGVTRIEARLRLLPSPGEDVSNTSRIVFHSLQQLTQKGKVIYDPATAYYSLLPEPRFIASYELAFVDAIRKGGKEAEADFQAGYQNFLEWAVRLAYIYGDRAEAQRLYDRLLREFGKTPLAAERYSIPLSDFVTRDLLENLATPADTREFIAAQVFQAIVQGLANEQPQIAENHLSLAGRIHRWYVLKFETGSVEADGRLAAMPVIAGDVLTQYLSLPAQQVDAIVKSRVWRNAPSDLRVRVPARVLDQLRSEAAAQDLDPELAFPGTTNGKTASPHPDAPARPGQPEPERR